MMNNNKILTVSYGTFSCTLEGFDDSFGTMKAIAEYFRDLAADDRYFGAEPPQPDAEMLARIAQKEVSRRVEAREQDGKIVLSALADHRESDATAELPSAAAIAEVPQTETAAAAAPVIEEETVSILTTPVDIDTLPEAEDASEIVIEEVSEAAPVKAVAEEEATAPDMPETAEESEVESQEAEAEVAVADAETDIADAVAAQAVEADMAEEDETDIVPGQPDADIEAFFADSPKVAEPDEDNMGQDAPVAAAAPAMDSIAAKLQRIRAVVAQQEATAEDEDDDYLEDEHAAAPVELDAAEDTPDVIASARADIEDALDADDATDSAAQSAAQADAKAAEVAATATDQQDDDDIDGILSRLESQPEEAAELDTVARQDPTETLAEEDAQDTVEDADTSIEDTVGNLFHAEEEALEQPAEAVVQTGSEERMSLRKTPRVTASPELSVEEAPEQPAAPRVARVIKVKRADLEAAIEKGDLEEYGEDEDDGIEAASAEKPAAPAKKRENPGLRDLDDLAPARSRSKTTLSPEDEAELTRELAELEDDISAKGNAVTKAASADEIDSDLDDDDFDDDDMPDAAEVAPRRPISTSARRALPAIDEGGEADVNRLLAETDHQMDEPESATRRDAFAHLRAAVAAKKADVAAGARDTTEDSGDDYRNDLAEVVRPRRPVSTSARTERPAEARPAPLKLVAEQRIDVEKPRAEGPVRPRRVAATTDVESDLPEGESFSDFAADMGATTLPQLLEAAAAYMSFVEGREQFSRPQLMSKVRQAGGEADFSREDGLRSFGQLLRTGKIEKIKAGRFTVSDEIGYRPDHRAAG